MRRDDHVLRLLLIIAAVAAGSLSGFADVAVHTAGDALEEREVVLRRADDYSQHVTAGRLMLRTESRFLDDERHNSVTEVEVWFDGVRSRVEQRRQAARTEEVWAVFDGERFVRAAPPEFRYGHVATPKELGELPRYVGGIPIVFGDLIGPALRHSPPLGETIAGWDAELAGEEQVADLKCLRLTAPPQAVGPARVTRSWWLAPSKGYALAQYCECGTWEAGDTASKRNVYTVEEWIQTSDGFWIPKTVSERVYIRKRGGEEQLGRIDRTELLSVAVNIEIPDDVFRIELPETTEMRRMD